MGGGVGLLLGRSREREREREITKNVPKLNFAWVG
jgi:hypothetical protein